MTIQCPECGCANSDDVANCTDCGCLLATDDSEDTKTDLALPSFKKGVKVGGRYEIVSEVGKGGFGRVFRAVDAKSEKLVALKVLNPSLTSDERVRSRFLGELKMSRRVVHPNIIRLTDVLEISGLLVLVMEFVEGVSLKQMIRRRGPFDVDLAYTILSQVCLGLDAAHRVGVVHRDVKPQNILITKNLGVKIVDLGLARHLGGKSVSQTGVIMGTPDYMSPEQVRGSSVDARSDIYSLGAVMYEMFTGRLPFTGESSVAILLAHLRQVPEAPMRVRPDLPPWVNYTILKAMAKKPSQRFGKTTELLAYFEKSMAESKLEKQTEARESKRPKEQTPAQTEPELPDRSDPRKRLRVVSKVLVASIVVLTIVAVVALRTHLESSERVQAIISLAKDHERQLDYYGSYEVYVEGMREIPGSVPLYVRTAMAYIQYLSQKHPLPLVLSLLVVLALLIAPLFVIQRRLRR
ncbi:MAG: serine/threonine protein kinase [Candidatus Coatesbacteria bacterium]|nr:serine/threonine protein kinase [Candidatus Coatesbacteria bacterium]